MQQTDIYKLNLLENSDTFSTQPINENTEAIETAINKVKTELDQKDSEQDAALSSHIQASNAAFNQITQQLSAVGNCHIAVGSYAGTGTYGAAAPMTLSFGFVPKLLIVASGIYFMFAVVGNEKALASAGATDKANLSDNTYSWRLPVQWSSTSVSWHNDSNSVSQFNVDGNTYWYIAIG